MAQCARCGRKLKDSQSMKRGYGPICWREEQEAQNAENDGAAVSAEGS